MVEHLLLISESLLDDGWLKVSGVSGRMNGSGYRKVMNEWSQASRQAAGHLHEQLEERGERDVLSDDW